VDWISGRRSGPAREEHLSAACRCAIVAREIDIMSPTMKRRMAPSLTLVLGAIFGRPVLAQEFPSPTGSYVVSPGSIGGQPTILLDRATGRTWYLAEVDAQGRLSITPPTSSGKPIWVPISFAPGPPKTPPH
jgi:hypothetical protein